MTRPAIPLSLPTSGQLRELEDKYAECMEMLREAQEELKNLRNRALPLSTPRRFHSLGLFPMVSGLGALMGSISGCSGGARVGALLRRDL